MGALLELKRDQRRDRRVRRLSAHGTNRRPIFSGCADWPKPGAMTSRPRSTTTLWLWLSNPPRPVLHARRGWAYLVSGAPQLALRDFEEAIRLDPSSGDAYSGRGSALVALGRCREAVADAEESLRHGESDVRSHYTAARILALAAESVQKDARARDLAVQVKVQIYQARALALLSQALERTPARERAEFWRTVVQPDQAFAALRRLPAYARMAATVSEPEAR